MRTIIMLVLLFATNLTIFSCTGQVLKNNKSIIKNDLQELKLKGKVNTLKETVFKAIDKFGEIHIGDTISKRIYSFNDKGNKIEDILNYLGKSFGDTSFEFTYIYKCNTNGNKIEGYFYPIYNSNWYSKYTYKYDENGNLIESNIFNQDGSLSHKNIFKYDREGNEIEKNDYKSDGNLYEKWIYKYDSIRNQTEDSKYNDNGSLYDKHAYKYDEKNNQIEVSSYKSDGNMYNKSKYKYDDKGNIIVEEIYNSDGSLIYTIIGIGT